MWISVIRETAALKKKIIFDCHLLMDKQDLSILETLAVNVNERQEFRRQGFVLSAPSRILFHSDLP